MSPAVRRGLLLLSVVGLCASTGACGAGAPQVTAARTVAPATTTTTIDPGLLPQTSEEPSVGSRLDDRIRTLWQAIISDRIDSALPLFFPQRAYQTMKTGLLADPAGDFHDRLMSFYRLDLEAYHASLGPDAASVTLLQVSVAPEDATWILPGHCENLIGYWHLPGIRMVYREAGVTRSFAVDSVISWHDEWYVVHLGPNPRPANVGTVDQPALGAGTPGPPGGC